MEDNEANEGEVWNFDQKIKEQFSVLKNLRSKLKEFFTSQNMGMMENNIMSEEDYLKETNNDFDFFEKWISVYAYQMKDDFRRVFETLDKFKQDSNTQGLIEWGSYKGEGYDQKMVREMRELTFI